MAAGRHPLAMLRDLGSVSDLWAALGTAGSPRLTTNSHVHLPPNFSAFSTVAEAIDRAAAQDVSVLGTSNYYDWSVYAPFARLAQRQRIFPLFGLEVICMLDDLREAGVRINDPGNPGKFYLCAKGLTRFEPMDGTAERLAAAVRRNDARRMAAMIARVSGVLAARGLPVSMDERSVQDMVRRRHGRAEDMPVYLQERHVAQAVQEALFVAVPPSRRPDVLGGVLDAPSTAAPDDVAAIQHEIRAHLLKAGKPGFVPESYLGFDHVYDLVLSLGGIPCYTVVADGMQPISEFERDIDRLIAELGRLRIHCSELIPTRNAPEVAERYTRALRGAGLIVLAGTEHNTLDMMPMEPACAGGLPIPDSLKEVYWEGACVVAAHQFLVAHGQTGYVDDAGRPNPHFATASERIDALAVLGANVIGAFRRAHGEAG